MCLAVYNGGKVHCRSLCSGIFYCMCYRLTLGAHFRLTISVPYAVLQWHGFDFVFIFART